jgi:ABC-2 type transport system ATP-binding protein
MAIGGTVREGAVLDLRSISKSFGNKKILSGVSFRIRNGEIVGLLGDNGAGKTTLANIIMGLTDPDGGMVTVRGLPLEPYRREILQHTNIASASMRLNGYASAYENLLTYAGLYSIAKPETKIRSLMREFGIGYLTDSQTKIYRLSQGENAKLNLCKALLNDPALLVLDEISSFLDADGKAALAARLKRMKADGSAVLLITHDETEARARCDRILRLTAGRCSDGSRPQTFVSPAPVPAGFSRGRFTAITAHYFRTMKRNPARFIEIFVWPATEMFLFALLAVGIQQSDGTARTAMALLAGVLFWNFTARIIQESVSQYVDDMLSNNMQNILVTPISLTELCLGSVAASFGKLLLSATLLVGVAMTVRPDFLAHVAPYGLAWIATLTLHGSVLSLFVLAALLMYGARLSFAGWFLSIGLQIVSCVVYPRQVLPAALKAVSYASVPSYVFESIRMFLSTGLPGPALAGANALTVVYLGIAVLTVSVAYRSARKSGNLAKI